VGKTHFPGGYNRAGVVQSELPDRNSQGYDPALITDFFHLYSLIMADSVEVLSPPSSVSINSLKARVSEGTVWCVGHCWGAV